MTRLTPSFLRVFAKVGLAVICVSALGYFLQGYREGKWWTSGYVWSLAVPVTIAPIAVWFMFVPKLVEFSDTEITIATLLGKYSYDWTDLDCFGPGNNVFKIQFFGDRQPYQIFAGAYSNEEWSKLMEFLNTHFPERKMAYSIDDRMFRKKDK